MVPPTLSLSYSSKSYRVNALHPLGRSLRTIGGRKKAGIKERKKRKGKSKGKDEEQDKKKDRKEESERKKKEKISENFVRKSQL